MFLEGQQLSSYNFRAPGAMHNARWMSKALYSLKIFLFKEQFHLTTREEKSLKNIRIFIIEFYIQFWFTSSFSLQSPANDFRLIQKLLNFRTENKKTATAALQKISNHLSYLSDECIGLSLFDDTICLDVKRKIVTAIKTSSSNDNIVKNLSLNINCEKNLDQWKKIKLEDLVSKNTLKLFERFDLNFDFLEIDPVLWNDNENYLFAKSLLSSLRVVNDCAERE